MEGKRIKQELKVSLVPAKDASMVAAAVVIFFSESVFFLLLLHPTGNLLLLPTGSLALEPSICVPES